MTDWIDYEKEKPPIKCTVIMSDGISMWFSRHDQNRFNHYTTRVMQDDWTKPPFLRTGNCIAWRKIDFDLPQVKNND